MEIRCEHCNAKLNIPDEKIPSNQRIAVHCPKCKARLTLDPSTAGPGTSSNAMDTGPSRNRIGDTAKAYMAEGSALEFFEEDVRLALVADTDSEHMEKIKQALENLGYTYVAGEDTNQAISKMRFHTFELVIIADQFDGVDLGQSPVLQYLNHLAMSIRRKIFVVLTGDTFNTMDHMTAFALSANLVVNRRDLDKLEGILKNAVFDNEKFYKVFMDTLSEIGKA